MRAELTLRPANLAVRERGRAHLPQADASYSELKKPNCRLSPIRKVRVCAGPAARAPLFDFALLAQFLLASWRAYRVPLSFSTD